MPPIRRSVRFIAGRRSGSEGSDISSRDTESSTSPVTPFDGGQGEIDLTQSVDPSNVHYRRNDSYSVDGDIYVISTPAPSHAQAQVSDIPKAQELVSSPHATEQASPSSSTLSAPDHPLTMAEFMKVAQKNPWDVRSPPPPTSFDSEPALVYPQVRSIVVYSPLLQVDFHFEREEHQSHFTVGDIYTCLYEMLCEKLDYTDHRYASLLPQKQVRIAEYTQMRMGGPSASVGLPWRGQLRDILCDECVVEQIELDRSLGKWRIDFGKGF